MFLGGLHGGSAVELPRAQVELAGVRLGGQGLGNGLAVVAKVLDGLLDEVA